MANTYNATLGYGNVEYRMTAEMAKEILKTRKGMDAKMHPQEYLCKVVNENFSIKGNCVKVSTDL